MVLITAQNPVVQQADCRLSKTLSVHNVCQTTTSGVESASIAPTTILPSLSACSSPLGPLLSFSIRLRNRNLPSIRFLCTLVSGNLVHYYYDFLVVCLL